MKLHSATLLISVVVFVFGLTHNLEAITLDDLTTYGGAIKTGNSIVSGGFYAPFIGPVSGAYASNILIPNDLKAMNFIFSATNFGINAPYLTFKVFNNEEFNTGWNDEGAIFHLFVPQREYLGESEPLGPPIHVNYYYSVDLSIYHGETVSFGWTYTQDDSMSEAIISDINFDQTPEPSTSILCAIGLIAIYFLQRKTINT